MSSSGDGREAAGAEASAPETRELGTPRGTGQIPEAVLDAAPGFPSPEPNTHGRARAMTVFSPVKRPWGRPPGGQWWLRLVFGVGRRLPDGKSTIRALSFIHFARWIVIRRIPDHGQPRERLGHPLLMFESNYNGTFDQYIDAFATILTRGMSLIWGTSYGFPGPQPVTPFKSYIRANEFVADHYYSAYPTATTTMVKSALALREPLRAFTVQAATLSPEQFRERYRAFLTEHQEDL
ncbi:MAG TPA: hypothetical protein VN213_09505 [Solirubrobacteraceae bacterium]|nr:hypothetical protein [Solirubrobacteraceae bacterium]